MKTPSAYLLINLLPLLGVQVQAALNGRCCMNGIPGVCVHKSSCFAKGGGYAPGFCPYDPPDVICCTLGACGSLSSQCSWTDQCKTKKWVSSKYH